MTMFTRRQFIEVGAAAMTVALAASAGWAAGYETLPMTVEEMQAGGALIVDIRAPEEWAETGVIEGAKLVTFTDADSFLAAVGGDLADGRDLVLICHSGRRSGLAAEALVGRVPNRIISAQGGMAAVIGAGYQTVAPE